MKKIILKIFSAVLLSLTVFSCSDRFVDTDFNQSVEQTSFTSVEELEATLNGAYGSMRNVSYYGRDYLMYAELRGDLMFSTGRSGRYTTIARLNVSGNHMLSTDAYARDTYQAIYTVVAKCNIIINSADAGLKWKESIDPVAIKDKIKNVKAKAHAVRALAFFDLLRLFGQKYVTGGTMGVVLPLEYNPKAIQGRSSIVETEAQINSDFSQAISDSDATSAYENVSNKTDLNRYSIRALAQRFYLYKADYAKVRSLVNDVVNAQVYTVAAKDLLKTSFTLNNASPNSVFELSVGVFGSLGSSSLNTIMGSQGSYKNVKVRSAGYAQYASTDIRKQLVTYLNSSYGSNAGYYVDKYSDINGEDNVKMCRYEEVLLNGIEAELNGGSAATALDYYNQIVTNRGLTTATSVDLPALKKERGKELLGEGFRMWDNFRWGVGVPYATSTGVSVAANNLPYGDNYLAFPIPKAEFNVPGNKMVQNAGYDQ